MKIALIILIGLLIISLALAQDPGVRDSLIIETVYAELGDSAIDVRMYVTCDDSVVFYNLPLAWYPDSGNAIYPVDISYFYPINYWDVQIDTILYDAGYIRMMGWANGGSPDPLLFTNNERAHCWTVHFVIDPSALPQIVTIDTTYDPITGSVLFVLVHGIFELTPEITLGAIYYGISSDADNDSQFLPEKISLLRNHPNPFNASTTIEFTLPEDTNVRLSVYNILGRKIAVLFEGRKPAGTHSLTWDAGELPSGVYFARLVKAGFSKSIKMILLK